jgi:probable HAF family extracellular repeat protein
MQGIGLSRRLFSTVFAALLFSSPAFSAEDYNYVTLDNPESFPYPGLDGGTRAYGINNLGQVVGTYPIRYYLLTYLFNGSSFEKLPISSYFQNVASGINDTGVVVGTRFVASTIQGVIVQDGNLIPLTVPNSVHSDAYGINNNGQVVGAFRTRADNLADTEHGFVYLNNQYTVLDVPNASSTTPRGINNWGLVVGTYQDSSGAKHGFMYNGESYMPLDVPNAKAGSTEAFGVNEQGQISGQYQDPTGGTHGFVYQDGQYRSVDVPQALPGNTFVTGINAKGQLVGWYNTKNIEGNSLKEHGFIAIPTVPVSNVCAPNAQYNFWTNTLIIDDVQLGSSHYWAKLQGQSNGGYLVVDAHEVAAGTCAEGSVVRYQGGQVTIPSVALFGGNLRVTLLQMGQPLLFSIKDAVKR